jgi:hypothetical protein
MKTKLLLFALLIIASISMSQAQIAGIANGDGTAANPYQIGTPNELIAFKTAVNTAAGTGAAAANYVLTANINMTNSGDFSGIGNATNVFAGNFNGKGFKISGLTLGSAGSPFAGGVDYNTGFFGFIATATISNLWVDVAYYVSSETSLVYTATICGGLVGTVTTGNAVINNCKVTGTIFSESTAASAAAGRAITGGLVGAANALNIANSTLIIINSTVNATLSSKTSMATSGSAICAGIVGHVWNSSGLIVNIVNCSADGSVSTTANSSGSFAGGIASTITSANNGIVKIYNCLAKNTISSTGVSTPTAYNQLAASGIGHMFNAANEIKNCMLLNPTISLYTTSTAMTYGLDRVFTGTTVTPINIDNNYAKADMTLQLAVSGGAYAPYVLTPANIVKEGRDGADLGSDAVGEATTKLNAYITTTPKFPDANGIALKTWIAGALTEGVTSVKQFELKPINYSIDNGILKVNGIVGSKQLRIYSVSGAIYKQLTVTDSYSTLLAKGIYMLKVEDFAPSKLVVY